MQGNAGEVFFLFQELVLSGQIAKHLDIKDTWNGVCIISLVKI